MKLHIFKYILLTLFISTTAAGFAQNKHEFSATAGGAWSSLKYKTNFENSENNYGGLFGVGYSYYFNKNWGVSSGAELSLYQSKIDINQLNSVQFNQRDDENDLMNYYSTVTNYNEKQKAVFLNIPLMLNYQTDGKTKLYLAGGAKIGVPISGKYEGAGETYVNKGYFPDLGLPLEGPLHMGYGTFKNRSVDKDIDFKVALMASFEGGVKWSIAQSSYLYTGLYVDYGLTDIVKDNRRQSFVAYNAASPTDFINNSLLNSSYNNNEQLQAITDKVILVAFGLKVRFAFGKGKVNEIKQVDYNPTVIQDNRATQREAEAEQKVAEAEARRLRSEAEMNQKINQQATQIQQLTEIQQKAEEAKVAKRIIEQPVSGYTVNETALSESKKEEMDKKIGLMNKYPDMKAVCIGHACNIGNEKINYNLGLERAEAAKTYLIKKGIAENRISILSKGSTEPIATNDSEENRRKNRRVEIVVSD